MTPHFTLAELTTTTTGLDNTPGKAHRANLQRLAERLELVRELVGRPVRVHSAYRSPAVNRAVGGVSNSAHALGYAADISVQGFTAYYLASLLRAARVALAFDQLILETSRGVVHISFDPRARDQVLTQPGGPGSTTLVGLVRPS